MLRCFLQGIIHGRKIFCREGIELRFCLVQLLREDVFTFELRLRRTFNRAIHAAIDFAELFAELALTGNHSTFFGGDEGRTEIFER